MPETEADRNLRQRRLRRASEERTRRESERANEMYESEPPASYTRGLEEEIAEVLRLLAERGYPNMVECNVCMKPSFFGRLFGNRGRISHKAGWRLGAHEYSGTLKGDRIFMSVFIYLLSDGRI